MIGKKVIFFLPTLELGGGERVASELSLHLPSSIETAFVLFQNKVSYPYNGKLICLNIPISINFFKKIYYFFVAILRLKKVIKKEDPDYVISFGTPANIINVLASNKAIVRIDNFMSFAEEGLYKALIKLFFNRAKKIICVSKTSAKDLADNFKIKENKMGVIYNPLNIDEIKKLASEPLDSMHLEIFSKPTIINIGRITRQKNQQRLIRSFGEIKKFEKEAQLVILGTGELEPKLKKMAEDLGLQDSVHFLGWQKNPFKFLAKSRAFVLSSLWEGLPYVILEAMALGLPVISVDCKSGPREILFPKSDINNEAKSIEYGDFGILVPASENNDFLGKAVIEVLRNNDLAASFSEKSRKRAEEFDVKNIIKEWDFLQ